MRARNVCEHVNVGEGGRGWSLASGSPLCLSFSTAFPFHRFPPYNAHSLIRLRVSITLLIMWTTAAVVYTVDYFSIFSVSRAFF